MATKKNKSRDSGKDEAILAVGKPNYYLRMMREAGVPEELIIQLRSAVNREIKEVKDHMETDGWDLAFDHIKSQCLEPIVSNWFEWYVIARICKAGYGLSFRKNEITEETRFVVTKPKKKRAKK